MGCLLTILKLAGLGVSWALVGWRLLPRALRLQSGPTLRWTGALALGAGLTAVILTLLAPLHMFGRAAVRLVAVLIGATALAIAVIHRRELREELDLRCDRVRFGKVAFGALGFILLFTLVSTCVPPAAMDATVYHLYAPAEFLRAGTWTKLDEVQTFQPLYVEMLFAEGLVIGGGPLAASIHWLLGLGAIGAAGAWARRFGAPAVWGALVFGGSALWVWESTSAFIDLGLALFASLSLLFVLCSDMGLGAVCMAGVFGGLAGGTKFTGLALAGLTSAVAFARSWPERKTAVRNTFVVGGIALLVAAPWYVRDFLLTGNPIFPLANSAFGLRPQPLASMTYGLGHDLLHLLSSPFDLLARGEKFDQGWATGPAYLAFVPIGLVLVGSRRPREGFLVAVYALLWWVIWFYSSPQTRLLVPILPAVAGLAAVAVDDSLASHQRVVVALSLSILAVEVSGALATAALYFRSAAPVLIGRESPDEYLRRTSWNYGAYKLTEKLVPNNARLAVTGSANNLYYLDRPARWLGKAPVQSSDLAAAGFEYELRVLPCPLEPLDDSRRAIMSEGDYPLPASRAGGGVYAQACYRLSMISPAGGTAH